MHRPAAWHTQRRNVPSPLPSSFSHLEPSKFSDSIQAALKLPFSGMLDDPVLTGGDRAECVKHDRAKLARFNAALKSGHPSDRRCQGYRRNRRVEA